MPLITGCHGSRARLLRLLAPLSESFYVATSYGQVS